MRVGRALIEGRARYVRFEEDGVVLLEAGDDPGTLVFHEVGRAESFDGYLVPTVPTKILAIGRNYRAHAREMNMVIGDVPSAFMKPLQSLVPHHGVVVLPPPELDSNVEHEAEVAIVIGRRARNVHRDDAHEYVFGLTCADDVSARTVQRSDPTNLRGKGFDTFCPLGPWVETGASIHGTYAVRGSVNGEVRQEGSTSEMVFDMPSLVEFLSSWTTLEPGDVILTGSPAGTGRIVAGDTVTISVDGVGTLEHAVALP